MKDFLATGYYLFLLGMGMVVLFFAFIFLEIGLERLIG